MIRIVDGGYTGLLVAEKNSEKINNKPKTYKKLKGFQVQNSTKFQFNPIDSTYSHTRPKTKTLVNFIIEHSTVANSDGALQRVRKSVIRKDGMKYDFYNDLNLIIRNESETVDKKAFAKRKFILSIPEKIRKFFKIEVPKVKWVRI